MAWMWGKKDVRVQPAYERQLVQMNENLGQICRHLIDIKVALQLMAEPLEDRVRQIEELTDQLRQSELGLHAIIEEEEQREHFGG